MSVKDSVNLLKEHCLFIAKQVFSRCYYSSQTFPRHAPTSVISTALLKKRHTGVLSHTCHWHIQFH